MKKSLFLSFFTALLLLSGCNFTAQEPSFEEVGEVTYFLDFDQEKYETALADGKTVFLDFHASWCLTCRANEPIIRKELDDRMDENLVAFKVDYDNSEELQKQFGIRSQSTLILIQDGKVDSYKTFGPGLISEEQMQEFLD